MTMSDRLGQWFSTPEWQSVYMNPVLWVGAGIILVLAVATRPRR